MDSIDMKSSQSEDLTVKTIAGLPAIQKAGYNLAIFILAIICGCLAVFLGLLAFDSFSSTANSTNLPNPGLSDSTFHHQIEVIKALQDAQKSHRDFFIQIAQMVLLNLLLPTLTAVLGYIFGSKEGSVASSANDKPQ